MNRRLINIWAGILLLAACSREAGLEEAQLPEYVPIKLAINTRAANDPNSMNQDQTFSSLAIYLFGSDVNAAPEQAALVPSFPAVMTREIPIETQPGDKWLYIVANYTGKTFKQANGSIFTLSTTTTRQQLDNLTTESSSGFSPASLLMVGRQALTIVSGDNGRQIDLQLRRLQARVDVHVYKGTNFGSNAVALEYIKLGNQVRNSEVKFDYSASTPQMPSSPMYYEQTVTNTSSLTPYINGTILRPGDAEAIFYSYQNLVTVFSPVQVTAPYLEIKLNSNSNTYTYKGYITDNNQTSNKYSLLQNNVYQVLALLDINSKITLNVNVLPWNQQNIEYERPVTSNDFVFSPWSNSWGGNNAKTMNTNAGGLEDAVFQFELKAPFGAAWTATLTNGLDFRFTTSTAGLSSPAVSSGFTNSGSPEFIAVRASKRWTGEARDTEFYITVEGNEIPINPVIGGQRRYPGTDTRIRITQVASYN